MYFEAAGTKINLCPKNTDCKLFSDPLIFKGQNVFGSYYIAALETVPSYMFTDTSLQGEMKCFNNWKRSMYAGADS